MFEDLSCLLATSDSSEGVDIPQCAYGEGYCRSAEVVWGAIAEDMRAISEPLLYGRNGAEEARIRRGDEANLLQQQETGIHVFPPKLSTKVFCSESHALSRIVARIRFASVRQWLTRSERPRMPAILASRSQAAQHIALEKVWTRIRPRNSHKLASGSNANTAACCPSSSRRANIAPSPIRGRRRSKNICAAARITLP